MTKEKYMALADFQTVWTNTIKPWIVAGFIAVTAVEAGATAQLVLQDGTLLPQSTFQAAGNYIVAVAGTDASAGNLVKADGTNIPQSTFVLASEKGANSGIATLGTDGKVPSSQLPSYVDDVIEGYLNATDGKFYEESTYTTEITAEGSKIYIDLATNKTYRWSGSAYGEIAAGLALGETQGSAYEGSKGKANADAISALQSGKADKVASATSGNLAGLDANGNLTDSGYKAADFQAAGSYKTTQSAVTDPTASGNATSFIDSISQNANGEISATKKTIPNAAASTSGEGGTNGLMSAADKEKLDGIDYSGKADKVASATSGNLAGLDANGNLTDSGSKASDFATAAQGTKADSAIQTVKVNGTALTPDANKAVDVEVPERVTSADLATFVV